MVEKKRRMVCVASRGGTGWFSTLGPERVRGGTIFAPSLLALRSQAEEIAKKRGEELHFEPQWSGPTYEKVFQARAARAEAEAAQVKAQASLEAAAGALLLEGFSVRDAAVVLGLSHQRVHQLFQEQQAKQRRK